MSRHDKLENLPIPMDIQKWLDILISNRFIYFSLSLSTKSEKIHIETRTLNINQLYVNLDIFSLG